MPRGSIASMSTAVPQPTNADLELSDSEAEDHEQGAASAVATDDDEDFAAESEEEQPLEGESSNNKQPRGAAHKASRKLSVAPDDLSDSDAPPKSKKARRSLAAATTTSKKGKGKGKAGKLEMFQEMPLDVLCEIAGHLDPITLLHMSRVNKSFRSLFMSKAARSIWIQARRTVFLPDLQAEDVSEALYAAMVFEKNCMVCGKPRASIVDYYIRTRWCKNCKKLNLVPSNQLYQYAGTEVLPLVPWTLTSLTGQNRSGRQYVNKIQAARVAAKLQRLQLAAKDAEKGKGKEKAVTEGEETPKDARDTLKEYIASRKRIVEHAREDGAAILQWQDSSAAQRRSANDDLRGQRRQAIEAKLLALGHDQRDFVFYNSAHIVDAPRLLSDAVWAKISAQLIAEVERHASARAASELRARAQQRSLLVKPFYDAIVASLPTPTEKALYPSLALVARFWEPEQPDGYIINQSLWDAAADARQAAVVEYQRLAKARYALTVANSLRSVKVPFEGLQELHPKLESRWSHTSALMITPTATDQEMDSLFAHFLAKFACSACATTHSYPNIVVHEHEKHSGRAYSTFLTHSWIKTLDKLVKQAELDLETVDDAALEALGPVFECFGCSAVRPPRVYPAYVQPPPAAAPIKTTKLTWSELIIHALEKHANEIQRGYPGHDFFERRERKSLRLQLIGTKQEEVTKPEAGPSRGELSAIEREMMSMMDMYSDSDGGYYDYDSDEMDMYGYPDYI